MRETETETETERQRQAETDRLSPDYSYEPVSPV